MKKQLAAHLIMGCLAVTSAALGAACSTESGYGSLAPEQTEASESALFAPGVPNPECSFQYFTYNPETGQSASPGMFWRYCVCPTQDDTDPLSIPLGGGWTYPSGTCTCSGPWCFPNQSL